MRFIKQLALLFGIVFLVASCRGNNDQDAQNNVPDSPEIGAALAQIPVEDRRIAIVHSQSTKSAFYDAIAYNQLFAAMQQQAMMAGVPFDLLDEAGLAATANLLDYDVIVIPSFTHVSAADRAAIRLRLLEAQDNGIGIITSGEFLAFKQDGTSYPWTDSVLTEVMGVQPESFLSGVSAAVKVANVTHPVTEAYEINEELTTYEQIWFGHFVPADGEQSTPLTVIESGGMTYNGAQIIQRSSNVVHYSNEQVMADNNQLWRVIQWLIYDDIAPVSLQLSRSDYIFLGRNDMDQAMIAADLARTEIPLLEILKEWKDDYNFVGSYYIDVGNDPASGEYTDWGISAPLYREYIALGNEIGTHSWTHPHQTSLLTAAELEFEFKDSAAEIGNEIGVPVVGAAVPGMGESTFVQETLNPWLEYLSGRTGTVGTGYPGAFGFLEPQHTMMYFSLNMTPDFEAIDVWGNTPEQVTTLWKNQIDMVLKHAQQPIVHWLWHDYGPTTQTDAGLYSEEMFTDTVAYAASLGAEFTTVKDMHDRIRTFAEIDFSVGSSGVVSATVAANDVGQFALKMAEKEKIKSVANWYAYDEDQVFLPADGGQFEISVGTVPDSVTRITKLPMRAKLLQLEGDGDLLNFSMQGEGEVTVELSPDMVEIYSVTGASSHTESNGELTLKFDSYATHVVEISVRNRAPVANSGSGEVESGQALQVELTGSDEDGDALTYWLQSQPANGTLTGAAPNLIYTANSGFLGTDSFSYSVNDGTLNSAVAQFDIVVTPIPLPEVPVTLSPVNVVQVPSYSPIPVKFLPVAGGVTEYQIQRFDRKELAWNYVKTHSAASICSATECSTSIPGMPEQNYAAWRLRARNSQGWGPFSGNAIFSVIHIPSEDPVLIAPKNFQTVVANAPVPVSFAPANGAGVLQYQLQRYDRIENRWSYVAISKTTDICSPTLCTTTVGAVAPQRYAVWRVRAFSEEGWGAWSDNAVFHAE